MRLVVVVRQFLAGVPAYRPTHSAKTHRDTTAPGPIVDRLCIRHALSNRTRMVKLYRLWGYSPVFFQTVHIA
jgi:hypothetical protein